MSSGLECNEKHFWKALRRLRDFRAWSYHNKKDPWAIRQSLITVLEIDTAAALDRGVSKGHLSQFDAGARATAGSIIERLRLEEKRLRLKRRQRPG